MSTHAIGPVGMSSEKRAPRAQRQATPTKARRRREIAFLRQVVRFVSSKRALRFFGKAWPVDVAADAWLGEVIEIPRPVERCDGSYVVPMWDCTRARWILTHDVSAGGRLKLRPRAQCPDRGRCGASHIEDFTRTELAKPHLQAAVARGRASAAAA